MSFLLAFRNLLLSAIYISAIALAAVLLYQTLQQAQQQPKLASIKELIPTMTSTVTATASAADPLTDFPTVVAATPVAGSINPGPVAPAVSVNPGVPPGPAPVGVDTDTPLLDEPVIVTQTDQTHPKTGRYVAAWVPPNFGGGARESFEANKDVLDEISPFWYTTGDNGSLYGTRDDQLVQLAREHNILVIPTINNVGNYDIVVGVLADPQIRTRHVQNIVDEVLARNYDGIDIDYESLDISVREDFSAFMIELSQALHAHSKLLSVAVHAKDRDDGGLGGFQDWAVLGEHVDRFRIMTYDYHWRGGGPGPVAPLYWVQSVAEYARTQVDPSKIFIGIPFYGYDWPPTGNARGLPWGDIEDLIDEEDLTVNLMQRNSSGRVDESWFRYPSDEGMREVWFMTSDGLESKLDLVQRMDLAGVAIWRIGYERPEYWDVIRRKLVQDPVLVQRSINPLLPEH
ncbi:MAG: glycoside hydrolase [Chloroflexaceae bacterium]|nr:glycoside hydrolase [Chloroflexaceae bacterium]